MEDVLSFSLDNHKQETKIDALMIQIHKLFSSLGNAGDGEFSKNCSPIVINPNKTKTPKMGQKLGSK